MHLYVPGCTDVNDIGRSHILCYNKKNQVTGMCARFSTAYCSCLSENFSATKNATEDNIQLSGYFSKSELSFACTEQQYTEILLDCSLSFYESHILDFTFID